MKYTKLKNILLKSCTFIVVLSVSSMTLASMPDGKKVFDQWCQGCHMDSPFAPGTIFLKSTRNKKEPVIENRHDLTPELVSHLVRNGFGGMPSFRNTEISAEELNALVNYLTNKNKG